MNDDDLSIPAFLRATGPGTPPTFEPGPSSNHSNTSESDWPFAVRRDNCTPADIAAMYEIAGRQADLDAVREYENQKSFAELQQWAIENPELARMNAKAKRDARRRIARLGIKPARRGR